MSCNKFEPWSRAETERGSALIEFVLCFGLFWIPLFLGASQFGLELIQAIQVTQVCRDAGHMYAYGIDFSQSSNQYLLASFAPSLDVDPTGVGGRSVVILSTVQYVDDKMCQAHGYTSTCPNSGVLVFTNQTIVGNSGLHASVYGTPKTSSGTVQPGSPTTSGYLNASSAVVQGYPNITLTSGSTGQQQYGYIAEMYSESNSLNWYLAGNPWVSAVSFF